MPSTYNSISYQEERGVGLISIDRPERKNALDMAARIELAAAFDRANASDGVRVVVVTGSGGAFSAGVDLKEVRDDKRHVLTRDEDPLVTPVDSCPKPVIAAIDGPAIGGGFELALAADMRIATPRSYFALTELRIGSLPGSGGTQRLFQAVPSAIAWRMLLTGELVTGARAYEVGLVSDLIEEDEFLERTWELAASIAEGAPLSLRAAKLAGRTALQQGGAGLALERTLWAFLSTTEDRAEGRAAFREKREPRYTGR